MWRPIFDLFDSTSRPLVEATAYDGILTDLSISTTACTVLDVSRGSCRPATLPWERRTLHLRDVATTCTAFRISVRVIDDVVTRAVMEIDDEAFRTQSNERGHVFGESHVVMLLASSWKDLTVRTPDIVNPHHRSPDSVTSCSVDDSGTLPLSTPLPCRALSLLMPHQRVSLAWMLAMEADDAVAYEGNLRLTSEWFVDTEEERLTRDASRRDARARGGILADWPGAGKTLTSLALCECSSRLEGARLDDEGVCTRGTLIVLPLNLHGQWLTEASRFLPSVRIISLISTRDVRSTTLGAIADADVVLTTVEFLSNSRAYHECIEDEVETSLGLERRACRTRAALTAWARTRATRDSPPIVEALTWHRIVVDEVHETFATSRKRRVVRALRGERRWGISATPALNPTALQEACYWLLRRDKAHHPNLLARLVERRVRVVASPVTESSRHHLQLVSASDAEMADIAQGGDDLEAVIRLCTRVVSTDDVVATATPESLVSATLAHPDFVRAQIDDMMRVDGVACPVCMDASSSVMLGCGHTLCRPCMTQVSRCPSCRRDACSDDARGVLISGTKAISIADAVVALDERVILFVQWRETLRGMRSVLRGRALRCFALDGNAAQRARSLAEFAASERGVLLLNLNDSFAGLHLPHVRHVMFTHAVVPLGRGDRVQDVEVQAVARCLRRGQTEAVTVHSFVVADSVEERVWRRDH